MGSIASLVFTESGTYYSIAKGFGKLIIDTIGTYYQALETSIQSTDNIKELKFRGLYTRLFESSNELPQDFLAKEATIIIDPDLWPGSYLPQRFYAAPNKESSVKKYDPYTFLREF